MAKENLLRILIFYSAIEVFRFIVITHKKNQKKFQAIWFDLDRVGKTLGMEKSLVEINKIEIDTSSR